MIYKNIPEDFNPRFEVVSCFVEFGGKLLFLHRLDEKSEGNKWGLPTGKIDDGEKEFDAMVRELYEETGQIVLPSVLEYLTKLFLRFPEYDFVFSLFRVKLDKLPEIIINTAEHKGYQWLAPKDIFTVEYVRDLPDCIKMFYKIDA